MSMNSADPKSGKKRKSKYSSTAEKVEIRVEVCDRDTDPTVCSFPGGLPEALLQEESDASLRRPPKFLWTKGGSSVVDGRKTKDAGSALIGKDSTCTYFSESSAAMPANKKKPATKMCIGVYDKKKKTVSLRQASWNGAVFTLQQSVHSYGGSKSAVDTPAKDPASVQRYQDLYEDFGSAKKRKALQSRKANIVNVDSVLGGGSLMVDSFLRGEGMSTSNRRVIEEMKRKQAGDGDNNNEGNEDSNAAGRDAAAAATLEWRRSFLPKFNQDAKKPHEVYDAVQIAGPEAWGRVSRIVQASMQAKDVAEALVLGPEHLRGSGKCHRWIASLQQVVRKVAACGGEQVEQQLTIAALLNHFANLFLRLNQRRFIPAPDLHRNLFFGTPTPSANRFLERFATKITGSSGEAGFVMSKANKDSCCVHMLLLYLMASSGTSMRVEDVSLFADDLKIDVKDASHLLRLAGCTVKGQTATSKKVSAFLPTPLTFPPMKKGSRSRR